MARGGSGDGRQEKAQPVAAERGAVTSFVGGANGSSRSYSSSTEVHVHFACEVELRVGGARDMANKYVPKVRYPR